MGWLGSACPTTPAPRKLLISAASSVGRGSTGSAARAGEPSPRARSPAAAVRWVRMDSTARFRGPSDRQPPGTAAAALGASVRARRSTRSGPQWAQLRDGRDHLVVGVAELVAARPEILVAKLVHGDLDRRADELGQDLPVRAVVGPRAAEIAALDRLAAQTRRLRCLPHVAYLELALVGREALGDVAGIRGRERLRVRTLAESAVDDHGLVAGHVVLEPHGLLLDQ